MEDYIFPIGMAVIVSTLLLLYITDRISRKVLGVEGKVTFLNSSVNSKHRKIDWTLRAAFLFLLVVIGIYFSAPERDFYLWFPVFLGYVLLTNLVLELIRAYMQKKYSEQKNEYKVTLIQIGVATMIYLIIWYILFSGVLFGPIILK